MKVKTKDLLHELQWAKRFTETKHAVPMLTHVCLTAKNGVLDLVATDLEVSGVTRVWADPYEEEQAWAVTIPPKLTIAYLQKVEDSTVDLTPTDARHLVIRHGDSGEASIVGMDADHYPVLNVPTATMQLYGLDLAIPRVLFAISKEESRFTLNGALLELNGDKRQLVSTDGHRMSLHDVGCKRENLD